MANRKKKEKFKEREPAPSPTGPLSNTKRSGDGVQDDNRGNPTTNASFTGGPLGRNYAYKKGKKKRY